MTESPKINAQENADSLNTQKIADCQTQSAEPLANCKTGSAMHFVRVGSAFTHYGWMVFEIRISAW